MMEREEQGAGSEATRAGTVWILVDHSSQEAALMPVTAALQEEGITVELVTITEVIGSVAREALAGGAERILRGLRVAVKGRNGDEDLIGAFRRRRPDVLVVTEPRFVRSIGVLENLTGVESLQVGLVPDFSVDAGWFSGQLHAFIVPDEKTAAEVVKAGYPEERVQVAGPALKPGFRVLPDREKVRKELGLGDTLTVLVRADGLDTATLEKLVFQCTLCDRDARFVFHHDSDGAAASTLRRAADQYGLTAAMFGRVPDLERYFSAADAILAAEDDGYLPEILHSKTPTLFVPSARSERGNARTLKEQGLADNLEDIGQLGTRLDSFLAEEKLSKYGEALQGWDGAEKHDQLVSALQKVVEHSAQWLRPVKKEEKSAGGDESARQKSEPAGPFETIGRAGEAVKDKSSEPSRSAADRESREVEPSRSSAAPASGLSQAEAKDELAKLILKERDQERQLAEISKQQERWRGRLQLAREWNEEDLSREAEEILRGYLEEAKPLETSLREIRIQKEKLKTAARSGQPGGPRGEGNGAAGDRAGKLEERFQKMEVDRDMEGLRDRIKRELGE